MSALRRGFLQVFIFEKTVITCKIEARGAHFFAYIAYCMPVRILRIVDIVCFRFISLCYNNCDFGQLDCSYSFTVMIFRVLKAKIAL
jgi:hypothetical protein